MCTRRLQSPRCSCLAGLPSQQEGRCGDGSGPAVPTRPGARLSSQLHTKRLPSGTPSLCAPSPLPALAVCPLTPPAVARPADLRTRSWLRLFWKVAALGPRGCASLAGSAHWACASEGPLCLTAARQLISFRTADAPLLGVPQFSHPFTYWRAAWWFAGVGTHERSCCEHPCAGFTVVVFSRSVAAGHVVRECARL